MSAPNMATWFVAVIIGVLGVLIQIDVISFPFVERLVAPFWLVTAGFGILAAGNIFRGL